MLVRFEAREIGSVIDRVLQFEETREAYGCSWSLMHDENVVVWIDYA